MQSLDSTWTYEYGTGELGHCGEDQFRLDLQKFSGLDNKMPVREREEHKSVSLISQGDMPYPFSEPVLLSWLKTEGNSAI